MLGLTSGSSDAFAISSQDHMISLRSSVLSLSQIILRRVSMPPCGTLPPSLAKPTLSSWQRL